MNETVLQLDMTAFFGAEKAMQALRSGRNISLLKRELRTEMAYLALVLGGSVLFDRITVAVPSVLDDDGDRDDFGSHASALSRVFVKERLVSVMKVAPGAKAAAIDDLKTNTSDYATSAADFLSNLTKTTTVKFRDWARCQLADAEIMTNTIAEEDASEVHKTWTIDFTKQVLNNLKRTRKQSFQMFCSQEELIHVVKNCGRGFIYDVAGAQRGTFYIPHFLREGLLGHLKDDKARARALLALVEPFVGENELAGIIAGCRSPVGTLPILKSTILDELLAKRAFNPAKLTDLIFAHRESFGNLALRKRLRETIAGPDPELRVCSWIKRIQNDKAVWAGKETPGLFKVIPALVQLIPGVSYEKAKIALEGLAPVLNSETTFGRTLRSPIYIRRHMRYLWQLHRFHETRNGGTQ